MTHSFPTRRSSDLEAASKYEIMPIVFFSIVFAIACLSVGKTAHPVIDFFTGLRDVLIRMIVWLMYLTPIGLFSLLGTAVAEASLQQDRKSTRLNSSH